MLYSLWMEDQNNPEGPKKLDFQSPEAQTLFEQSIPECVKNEVIQKKNFGVDQSEHSDDSVDFITKLVQIKNAILFEQELYELLKDLKKEKNRNKRLP